ncbi:MAG: NYN domain-containing protein [Microcystaceae cyanobacterium]
MAKKQKPSVAVYHDYQNVPLSESELSNLKTFANSKGQIKLAKGVFNSNNQGQRSKIESLSDKWIQYKGIDCCSHNTDDNQLIAEGLKDLNNSNVDVFILVTKDKDFIPLAQTIKKYGKSLLIIGHKDKDKISKKLRTLADEIYSINELESKVLAMSRSSQSCCSKPIISYQQAVTVLTTALQICLRNKKRATLSYIGKLMKEQCPKYQGASSILRPNQVEKTFSKLSQFIEMVAKEGKIKLQGQELIVLT